MDAFGRVVAIILAVVLLFLFPLKYLAYNQDRILDNNIQSETNDFVENVMNEGYISINMYENLLGQLNQTEQVYDIEMVHSKPLEGYDEVSHRNVLNKLAQVSTHKSNSADSNKYSGNINKADNKGFTTLGVATKQYKLTTLENAPLSGSFQQTATHVHTDDCYNGIKHVHTGNSTTGGGCYGTYVPHEHTSSCSYTTGWYLLCNKCYDSVANSDGYVKNPHTCTNYSLTQYTTKNYTCDGTSYYTIDCGKVAENYYNGSILVSPTCNNVVTSITATNPTQIVIKGNSIVSTATATYLDGHTGTVNCTNNYIGTVGTQLVTLTYTGLVGDAKTNGTRTTTMSITTQPNTVPCMAGKGHPNYSASLSECPICKAINGISISSPIVYYTGSGQGLTVTSSTGAETKVYYNGSSMLPIAIGDYSASIYVVIDGQSWLCKQTTFTIKKVAISLDVVLSKSTVLKGEAFPLSYLTATYADGSSNTTGFGYTLSGFDKNTIGTQNVTIYFEGASTVKTINVVSPVMIACTAGKGHPNYSETYTECPICKAIKGITVSNQIASYTGSGQGLTATSSTGAETKVYYNGSSMLPIAIGDYYADISVVVDGVAWPGIRTTFTITKAIKSITAYCNTEYIVGSNFVVGILQIDYNDGTRKYISSGYTISGYNPYQFGIQNVTISYGGKSYIQTCTVKAKLNSISLIPSKSVMYKGDSAPTFTAKAYFDNGTSAIILQSSLTAVRPFYNICGSITVQYKYLYIGQYYAIPSCMILVKPNITSINVIPSETTVFNGYEPTYQIIGTYEDGSTKTLTSGVTKSGFTPGAGTKMVRFTYTENGKTVTDTIIIEVKRNTAICKYGHTYELDDFDSDLGCSICKVTVSKITVAPQYVTVDKGSTLPITVTATYLDGHTNVITSGWTSDFDNTKLGNQLVTVSYEGKTTYVSVTVEAEDRACPICYNTYKLNADGSDPGCPICSKTVASISASPETQIVSIENGINFEVTATYKDGHSAFVTGWTSNFDSFKAGTQLVTVYYKNVTTTVTVIVESPTETTCPICGTVYNPQQYVNGCPYCANTVDSIEARLRSGGNLVQLGSDINIAVILIFKDGHRELAYNNYTVEGYEPNVLGNQTITVKYNEFTTTLDIEVVNTLSKTVCENGHVYYLNADGSDPGCPLCSSAINQEKTVKEYFNCVYTDEILEKLYADEIYTFKSGDFITVNVSMKTKTLLNKLQNIFMDIDKPNENYRYGGMILGPCI